MDTLPLLEVRSNPSLWHRLFLRGVTVPCRVGIPLRRILLEDFGLAPETADKAVDVYFLDGRPVDDLDTALPADGSRLALAAGLPGVAGIAMKRGSAVKGLRPGITHAGTTASEPGAGSLTLALFSLALPMLAGHFLARGLRAPADLVCEICRLRPDTPCRLNGQDLPCGAAAGLFAGTGDIALTVRAA